MAIGVAYRPQIDWRNVSTSRSLSLAKVDRKMKVLLAVVCLVVGANAIKMGAPFRSQPKGRCPPPTCPAENPLWPVFHPDLDDCSSFYMCANGIPYHFTCPDPLKFNPKLNVCDWPMNVQCPTGCPITCPPVDGPNSVYFPDPTSCSGFFQCSNGVPHHFDCPSGLHFNAILNVCDWPDSAQCNI